MREGKEKISVIVASHNAAKSIEDCLSALETQASRYGAAEIITVDNSTDGTQDIIKEKFPSVRLITMPSAALIPQLWEAGIRESKCGIVALTTSHFIPKPDWIEQIALSHEAPAPAIGGAIVNDNAAGIVDWAVYFCRYSKYMPPFMEASVSDIAGDNASYKKEYLDKYEYAWRGGFWEPSLHAELTKTGLQILLVPSIVVCHKHSFGFRDFMRQRFLHGKQFGRWRASSVSAVKRACYIAISPAIPLVLFHRIVRRVLARGRHRTSLLVSSPILVSFLLAWSFGELTGYLSRAEALRDRSTA